MLAQLRVTPTCALSNRPRTRRSARSLTSRTQAVQTNAPMATEWLQRTIDLPAYKRGCHVITKKVYEALPELSQFEVGLANIFILHTSASLTINENASPDVPLDLNDALDRIAPEGNMYRHLDEGPDDMPAHVKSSLMGPSLTVPVSGGRFALGTWQGIYLNEHRNYGGSRRVTVTIQGTKRTDGRSYPSPGAR
uniref:Secondary thiamine-phosphate synthase enzyme n=1 Tax=Chlamydomonas euryale TaxID=1486919 RepID=A0A7R9YS02_9CHLO|mmetsp:Transcript_17050/g.51181  ORF Transcript_17050/g.51181 Transcript_17050/m.51181 type:complete len:194 (+) Transcript_17050:70-651(+)